MPAKSKNKGKSNPVPDITQVEQDFLPMQRMLREVIEQQKTGIAALVPIRHLLLKVFGRIARLREQIDACFGGQAFFRNYSPTAPANIERFKSFTGAQSRADRLLFRAIESWCLTCGVRWECDSKTCAARNCPMRGKRPRRAPSTSKN